MTATAVDYVLPNSVGNEQRSISKRQAIVFVIDLTFGSAMLHILQKSIEKVMGKHRENHVVVLDNRTAG